MDSYLPADFFIADDTARATRGEPAFVTGLRDWSKPRGEYPRRAPSPRVRHAQLERVRWAADGEWRPL